MPKLNIIRNLKPRRAFPYFRFAFVGYAWDILSCESSFGRDNSQIKRITVETEEAVYEHIFPSPRPYTGAANALRPALALLDLRGGTDSKHSLVETVDKADGIKGAAS